MFTFCAAQQNVLNIINVLQFFLTYSFLNPNVCLQSFFFVGQRDDVKPAAECKTCPCVCSHYKQNEDPLAPQYKRSRRLDSFIFIHTSAWEWIQTRGPPAVSRQC